MEEFGAKSNKTQRAEGGGSISAAVIAKPLQQQRSSSIPHLLQEMSSAIECGLMVEITPFVECHDVLAVTFSFLDIQSVHSCTRRVCQRWNQAAQERIEGREEDIANFVRLYNTEVERQYNLKTSVSQGSKLRFLVCSLAAIPGSLLPWVVIMVHHQHVLGRRNGEDHSFSFLAGVLWAVVSALFYLSVQVLAGLLFYKSHKVSALNGPQLVAFGIYHFINVGCFSCWFTLYVWFNTGPDSGEEFWNTYPIVKLALTLPTVYVYFSFFLYMFGSAAGIVSWVDGEICIHVKQIRNPIYPLLLSEGGNQRSSSIFERRRQVVTPAEVEQMMADWSAAHEAEEEITSSTPGTAG